MADFFRGLQGGFQTGMQLGQAMRQRRMEEDLARAYGLTPQEQQAAMATPEQLQRAQAETQALQQQDIAEFGLTPETQGLYTQRMPQEGARVGPSTYTIGKESFAQAPTQAQIDAARMRAAADVYGQYGDAARREELMRGLRAEERAQAEQEYLAKARPMQLESAGLKLEGERAESGDRRRMGEFQTWMQEDPTRAQNFQAVAAKARELGMSMDQQFKIASNLTGIDEAEFKAGEMRIRKMVQGQGLDGLLKLHKDSADLDPGSHFEKTVGKDGRVTLNRVDTATGKVIQPNVFSGKEDEVVGYLNKAARDPAAIVDYTMNLRKNQVAIEKDVAATEASRAYAAKLSASSDEAKGLEKKLQDAEKILGRKLTEDEKKIAIGLVPRPREVSNADVIALSKELVGKATGRRVDGKEERYTQETALSAARSMLEQQPTTTGMPGWGERPPAPTAAPAAPRAAAPAPRVDSMALQIDKETNELAAGVRTAYSPEVQAVLDAQSAARRQGEQSYLQREQSLATGRGLWR